MAVNQDYLQYVEEQLSGMRPFESKKMFGGIGFFKEGIMFGMIGKNIFHLKADDHNRPDYEAAGMKAFMSSAKSKGMPYYEVPASILED